MTDYTKLSDLSPVRTAGALPSTRTEDVLYTNAMESEDLATVKAILHHVWSHYQALEFLLHGRDMNQAVLQQAKAGAELDGLDIDRTDSELAVDYFATGAIETAYAVAHMVNDIIEAGLADTAPQALRVVFNDYDYSDPAREVSDAELADFLNSINTTDKENDK